MTTSKVTSMFRSVSVPLPLVERYTVLTRRTCASFLSKQRRESQVGLQQTYVFGIEEATGENPGRRLSKAATSVRYLIDKNGRRINVEQEEVRTHCSKSRRSPCRCSTLSSGMKSHFTNASLGSGDSLRNTSLTLCQTTEIGLVRFYFVISPGHI